MNAAIEHINAQINGINMHIVCAGPQDGTPVILLHGFPEFWFAWRNQVDALVNAGFRLWMPDQRGYNLTEKPRDVSAYNLDTLADDIIGLIDHMGQEKALIVGHDWGGAAAWWLAARSPERIEKLTLLNIPHHRAVSRAVRTDRRQRLNLLYMGFFQMPILPELVTRFAGGRLLARWAFGSKNPAFPPEDVKQYRQAWAQPGAITAMLNWYRAMRVARPERLPDPNITVPTLLIWGKRDQVFKPELAQASIELCEQGKLVYIDEATHWVQHEAAERVNEVLIEWLRS